MKHLIGTFSVPRLPAIVPLLCLASCILDAGDLREGPAGKDGAPGPQGPQGPKGDPGSGGAGATATTATGASTTSSASSGGGVGGDPTSSGTSGGGGGAAPSCNDAVINGDETSVDCGGSCSPCLNGNGCILPSDCVSAYCNASLQCAQRVLLLDDFNRPDSSAIGGTWTDDTDPADNYKIVSNRLLSSSASAVDAPHVIHQLIAQHQHLVATGVVQRSGGTADTNLQIRVLSTGAFDSGYGATIMDCRQAGATYIAIMDGTTVHGSTTIGLFPLGVDYAFEVRVGVDYKLELRLWQSGTPRPLDSTIEYSPPPGSIQAAGVELSIQDADGTSAAGTYSAMVDDLLVVELSAAGQPCASNGECEGGTCVAGACN